MVVNKRVLEHPSVQSFRHLLAVCLIAPGTATAQIGDGKPQCAIRAKFEPGPIVNGHQRQPTQREFDARMQILQEEAKIRIMQGCDSLP